MYEEVAYGLENRKMPKKPWMNRSGKRWRPWDLLPTCKVSPVPVLWPKTPAGGGCGLGLQPRTLILDEITNGQDEQEKHHMMQYLSRLQEEKHLTLILITHDMEIARQYTTHSLVLHDGQLVYDGSTRDLFDGERPLRNGA